MQFAGHIIVDGKTIKVLCRPNLSHKHTSLKLRTTGKNGQFLEDESLYLEDEPTLLNELLNKKVIIL